MLRLVLAFAAIYTIWGSTYLAIRLAIETIPPFLMLGIRFSLAGLILYGFLRLRGAARPGLRELGAAAVVGGLLLGGGTGAVAWSEQWIATGLAALLVAMVPMWMVLLDWLRPGGRRPSLPVAFGLIIGMIGVATLVGPVELEGEGRLQSLGALALVFGTLSWSIGSVYGQRLPLPRSILMSAALQMISGGAILMVAGSAAGQWNRFDLAAITPRSFLAVAYLIVFGSLIAFAAYNYLLRTTTPARVGSYAYVNPVVAVLLGWAFAGEPITADTLMAAAVIVTGVVLIVSFRGTARAPERRASITAAHQALGTSDS